MVALAGASLPDHYRATYEYDENSNLTLEKTNTYTYFNYTYARDNIMTAWVGKFLAQRVLCGYCGTQQKDHSRVYPKPARGGLCRGSDQHQGIYRPVYGDKNEKL